MKRRWILPENADDPTPLANACGIAPVIARLLYNRGIREPGPARRFLDPRLGDLADPMRLPDMPTAATRLWRAVRERERIALFGDYDVDGVTAISLLCQVINALGGRAECFVPRRIDEGYGLTVSALQRCCSLIRPSLVVAMDCGTTSITEAEWLRQHEIDLVIADHHLLPPQLPHCVALVNPQRGSGDRHLCSAGLAFKLAHALLKVIGDRRVDLREHLDLVALGTIADIVPLVDDNRILAHAGLGRLASSRKPGIRHLMRVARIQDEPTAFDASFRLAPRINAAGRLDDAMAAVRLLTTADDAEAASLAQQLDVRNRERQELEKTALADAMARVTNSFNPANDHALVLADRAWHPGIIGLVASRLQQHFWRPTFVIAIAPDGRGKGSGRGVEGCHLVEGLHECAAHIEGFGGHALAAGLYIREHAIPAFRETFNAWAGERLTGDLRIAPLRLDAEIAFRDLNREFMTNLASLAPFGQSNPEPLFLVRRVRLARQPSVVGHNHLRLAMVHENVTMDAIGFGMADRLGDLPDGDFDIAGVPILDSYWTPPRITWRLRDFRPAVSSPRHPVIPTTASDPASPPPPGRSSPPRTPARP